MSKTQPYNNVAVAPAVHKKISVIATKLGCSNGLAIATLVVLCSKVNLPDAEKALKIAQRKPAPKPVVKKVAKKAAKKRPVSLKTAIARYDRAAGITGPPTEPASTPPVADTTGGKETSADTDMSVIMAEKEDPTQLKLGDDIATEPAPSLSNSDSVPEPVNA